MRRRATGLTISVVCVRETRKFLISARIYIASVRGAPQMRQSLVCKSGDSGELWWETREVRTGRRLFFVVIIVIGIVIIIDSNTEQIVAENTQHSASDSLFCRGCKTARMWGWHRCAGRFPSRWHPNSREGKRGSTRAKLITRKKDRTHHRGYKLYLNVPTMGESLQKGLMTKLSIHLPLPHPIPIPAREKDAQSASSHLHLAINFARQLELMHLGTHWSRNSNKYCGKEEGWRTCWHEFRTSAIATGRVILPNGVKNRLSKIAHSWEGESVQKLPSMPETWCLGETT